MAWNEKDETNAALAVTPLMREIVDYVRAKLPDGTHFAVLIEVNSIAHREARVIAASTDRERMSVRAAEWALSVDGRASSPEEAGPNE